MTSNAVVELRPAIAQPGRVGQGTAVEQSRAVAEVQAAIFVARQFPRDTQTAMEAMEDSCKQMELASRAFFEYPRGGQTVSGPSVHLARELARIWGNFQYGITELRRDDTHGQSEMLAFAWDVQTNVRNSNTFINPHVRDTRDGPVALTDGRDIYESNANQGARRVREAILATLPPWFVEKAKQVCQETLEHGGGVPLQQRIAEAIKVFARNGVSQARMEAKFGRPASDWRAGDVARLGVIYESLRQGTVTVEDEFPDTGAVSAAEILGDGQAAPAGKAQAGRRQRKGAQQGAAPPDAGAGQEQAAQEEPAGLSEGQVNLIRGGFGKLGFEETDGPEILNYAIILAGIDTAGLAPDEWPIGGLADLTQEQGRRVQKQLAACKTRDDLIALVTAGEKPGGGQGTLA